MRSAKKDLARFRDQAGYLMSRTMRQGIFEPLVYKTKDGMTICPKCARRTENFSCTQGILGQRDLYPASVLDGGGVFIRGMTFECQIPYCGNLLRPVEELCP